MPSATACRTETEALHEFFCRWYCGTTPPGAFARLERALGSEFERVTPDGTVQERETVLVGVRETYDAYESFDIEVRNVEPVTVDGNRALVRYEEWQTTPDGENGRVSTALFGPADRTDDADPSVTPVATWHHLHETWLDAPAEQ